MASTLKHDLQLLDALAYHRKDCLLDDVRRFHALRRKLGARAVTQIEALYRWLFIPITLWPLNFQDIFQTCLDVIGAGGQLEGDIRFLLQSLPEIPSESVYRVVAEHERLVQRGDYKNLVTTTAKFDSIEKEAERNPDLLHSWQAIKQRWEVSGFADSKGVIRRTFTTERNLRPSFSVDWTRPEARFQAAFDAFCSRWNLYGMQGDKPLSMNLSVNLTPHGTMIFIPAYWSFDPKRDVRWNAVNKLHRVRSLKKQGEVLSAGTAERRKMAVKLQKLDVEAKRLGLRGQSKHRFLCTDLGWVESTDPKRLARLRREFDKSGGV